MFKNTLNDKYMSVSVQYSIISNNKDRYVSHSDVTGTYKTKETHVRAIVR